VNINNWLVDEGYMKLYADGASDGMSTLEYADWGNSQAYFVGFNGLYLNLKGREGEGIVGAERRRPLLEEIKAKLEALRDPQSGERVVSTAYISEDTFSHDYLNRAPDIVVGFNKGYRSGDGSALAELSAETVADNMDWWSGDHLIDPKLVPASFISSFPINKKVPAIIDVAPTILKYFGSDHKPSFKGKSLI
jgi:predicted AlkP superfamily phosphohydrolase/phosphomutase